MFNIVILCFWIIVIIYLWIFIFHKRHTFREIGCQTQLWYDLRVCHALYTSKQVNDDGQTDKHPNSICIQSLGFEAYNHAYDANLINDETVKNIRSVSVSQCVGAVQVWAMLKLEVQLIYYREWTSSKTQLIPLMFSIQNCLLSNETHRKTLWYLKLFETYLPGSCHFYPR